MFLKYLLKSICSLSGLPRCEKTGGVKGVGGVKIPELALFLIGVGSSAVYLSLLALPPFLCPPKVLPPVKSVDQSFFLN